MATASEADLDAAYAGLIEAGVQPTVRALRDQARVGRDRAAAYLRERASGDQQLALPAEQLAGVLGPLWNLAVDKARQAFTEEHQGQQAAAVESEAAALGRVEQLEAELATATGEADRLTAELQTVSSRVEQLETSLETERERARAAEARAARAEGEADTLRAVVGLREATDTGTKRS